MAYRFCRRHAAQQAQEIELALFKQRILERLGTGFRRRVFEWLLARADRMPWWLRRLVFRPIHARIGMSFRFFIVGAARLDPECAMCYWGAAQVLGPNINAAMDPANAPKPRADAAGVRISMPCSVAPDAANVRATNGIWRREADSFAGRRRRTLDP